MTDFNNLSKEINYLQATEKFLLLVLLLSYIINTK